MIATHAPRLLIVEDSPSDQRIYRRTLHDFEIRFADSGEAALECLRREPFDAVILDFDLPGLDGAQVLSRIRDGLALDLPVVIVTGGGSEDLAVGLLKQGADDYVTKDLLPTPRVAAAVLGAMDRHRLDRARRDAEDALRRRNDELEHALRQLKEAQAQLIQGEKMASLGQLVAGVRPRDQQPPLLRRQQPGRPRPRRARGRRHHGRLSRPLRRRHPRAIREAEDRVDLPYTLANLDRLLRSSRQGLDRVGQIVAGLRDFSRLDEGHRKLIDPNEAVRTTVEMVRHEIRLKDATLDLHLPPLPRVWCNPGTINQVLLNLLVNALQAVGRGARIAVSTAADLEQVGGLLPRRRRRPRHPRGDPRQDFRPLLHHQAPGAGTGLGLWISYNIAKDHEGRLEMETEGGRGADLHLDHPLRLPSDLP